ncbi:MAG TPA: hypothetical protein VLE23_15520 [Geminicoccaceae bacterium]|nr:hypothetical protein [Geminicoccaceae bacterium]
MISWRQGAWRRRRLGVGTAWSLCLIGWIGALLLPGHDVAEPEVERASGAASGADPPDSLAPALQVSRDKAASLRTDHVAALALRASRARHLAEVPRALDGGQQRNPIHQQAEVQLRHQKALIAVLESQLAAEQIRTPCCFWSVAAWRLCRCRRPLSLGARPSQATAAWLLLAI